MPGLLRGIARTAVISGTATAVSNRVSRRQAGRWAQQADQRQLMEPPGYAAPAQPAQPAPPPAQPAVSQPLTDDMSHKIDQLKQLADLKAQGVLSDEEFESQKRRLLG
ncbi:SHOCT domain-containing protein [Streptomyces sp. NPDC001595]|uniref:SHOCT domain-containing protein n=1 Tax=Streptomyces sp. NPDC001532 TaxID=3154520 RepID=UPI00332FEEC2